MGHPYECAIEGRPEMPTNKLFVFAVLPLAVVTLTACSSSNATSPPAKPLLIDQASPVPGEPAKIVETGAGQRLAFSFEENGQQVTCTANVELDAQQQVVKTRQWQMTCTQPPAQPQQTAETRKLDLPADALFRIGKSSVTDLQPGSRKRIEQFAQQLRREYREQPHLIVTGHTDRLGPDAVNRKLSLARARTVASLLTQQGIARNLIKVQGKGSEDPIVQCPGSRATLELVHCLQPNRRVNVQVIGD